MFGDNQFYPTPEPVRYRMTEGLKLNRKKILDPSAGRGDLLDHVKQLTSNGYLGAADLYAIEIDSDLRRILLDKNYKVIDTDFLNYGGYHYFDLILMNPPFRQGAAHLLKAWEISQGATIRCLLNIETLRNETSQERRRLNSIIDQFGKVENLGSIFKRAERPADVEIALVELIDTRPKEDFRINFDPTLMGANDFEISDLPQNELAPLNLFESYEGRYKAAISAFKDLLAARQRVSFYMSGLLPDHKEPAEIIGAVLKEGKTPDVAYSEYLTRLTSEAWNMVFSRTKLREMATEGVREKIEQMQAEQGAMAFTADNMEDLFLTIMVNRDQIIIKCALEVFDSLTKHHHENRLYLEGWKTNSAYFVGKKFILPGIKSYWSDSIDYSSSRTLDDIERVMCFLSGKKFESIRSIYHTYDRSAYFGEWVTTTFFQTKLHKKGTMHFRFRDENLQKEFNALIAREKWGWLPEKIKTGVYK